MPGHKQRQVENTAIALRHRYGPQALRKASTLPRSLPPHISTGFTTLDAITGCAGVPLGAITLFSGHMTSGKLTLAYKLLMQAQQLAPKAKERATVALLDLPHSADPDYLARAGVDLDHLLITRPQKVEQAVDILVDLISSSQIRLVVLDNLTDILAVRSASRQLRQALGQINTLLRHTNTTLILIDEPSPPWLRWLNWDRSSPIRQYAALHVEMQRENWLIHKEELIGYQARACVLKSRWTRGTPTAPIAIQFNGTVKARETW